MTTFAEKKYAEQLGSIEREVIEIKRKVKSGNSTPQDAHQLDLLKAIAKGYRALLAAKKLGTVNEPDRFAGRQPGSTHR